MELLYDAAVILLFVLTAIAGYMRGFMKYTVMLVVTVVSLFGGFFTSSLLSEKIYDEYIEQHINEASENFAQNIDLLSLIRKGLENSECRQISDRISDEDIKTAFSEGNILDNVQNLAVQNGLDIDQATKARDQFAEEIDKGIGQNLNTTIGQNGIKNISDKVNISMDQISKIAGFMLNGQNKQAAEYVNRNVISPMVMPILKIAVFLASFIIFSLLIKLILHIAGVFKKYSSKSALNRAGGLALGLAKGALYSTVMGFIVCFIVNSTSNSINCCNLQIVEKTKVFKYFFNIFYK